jgi:hypothetical protein
MLFGSQNSNTNENEISSNRMWSFDDLQPLRSSNCEHTHTEEWPKSDHGIDDAWRNGDIKLYLPQKWTKHWHRTPTNLLDCLKHACALLILIWSPCLWTLSSLLPLVLRFSFRASNPRMCNCWVSNFLKNDSQQIEAPRHNANVQEL